MKRIITIILALVMAVLLCGCGKSAFDVQEHHGKRFEVIEEYDDCTIYVDMETGVEYAERAGYTNITVLLDSYGNPLIYPGFDAREDRLP